MREIRYCNWDDGTEDRCGQLVEGNTEYCATHNKEIRKAAKKPIKKIPEKIARRTPQRAAEEAIYNAEVKVWLKGKPCAVYPDQIATQCHHKKGRIGKLLLDKRYWLPVSNDGHEWINNHPLEAIAKGFSLLRTTNEEETNEEATED
jgi:hypothetical protein